MKRQERVTKVFYCECLFIIYNYRWQHFNCDNIQLRNCRSGESSPDTPVTIMLFEGMVPPLQSATNINYCQCDFKSFWKAFGFKVFTLNQRCLLLKVLRPHVKTVGTKTATWNELHILCSLIIHQTRELTKQFLQENNLNQFLNLSNNDINIQKL